MKPKKEDVIKHLRYLADMFEKGTHEITEAKIDFSTEHDSMEIGCSGYKTHLPTGYHDLSIKLRIQKVKQHE